MQRAATPLRAGLQIHAGLSACHYLYHCLSRENRHAMRSSQIWIFALVAANLLAAETPSPALLVLNKEDNALAIVDPVSKKVVGRVPTGQAPHEATVSSDGKLAFAANYGAQQTPGNTISVID